MRYSITRPTDDDAAYEPIWAHLLAFNQARMGNADGVPFALVLTDEDGSDAQHGGLWGLSRWGSFYVALLVVPEEARHQGLGSRLMAAAEAEARARGCWQIWLDTYAFQARGFYERLGYSVFGQIDGPAPAFPRSFMEKRLTS